EQPVLHKLRAHLVGVVGHLHCLGRCCFRGVLALDGKYDHQKQQDDHRQDDAEIHIELFAHGHNSFSTRRLVFLALIDLRIELELDDTHAFVAGGLESPFFHRIYCSIDKNRIATDYFGVFHCAVGRDCDFKLHHAGEIHLAGDFGIRRADFAFDTSLQRILRGRSADGKTGKQACENDRKNERLAHTTSDLSKRHNSPLKVGNALLNAKQIPRREPLRSKLSTSDFSGTYVRFWDEDWFLRHREIVSFGIPMSQYETNPSYVDAGYAALRYRLFLLDSN